MKKLVTFIFFCLLFTLYCLPSTVFSKDFSSYYKTTYEFDTQGNAFVTAEISLINENPNLYISQYSLSLGETKVSEVYGYDNYGSLDIKTEVTDKTTIILIKFNEKTVGKNKINTIIIKYKVKDLSQKEGSLWKINLPKLSNAQEVDDYKVIAKIPKSFGNLSFISPYVESNLVNNYYILNFEKKDLLTQGVSATFGQFQTFDFLFFYDLSNSKRIPGQYFITLPPDTNYQTVYISSLKPEPVNVKEDEDGNWLAYYNLNPNENIRIEATGKINIFPFPQKKINLDNLDLSNYLLKQKYWDIESDEIKTLAKKYKTVKEIYKFVVSTLSYNYNAVSEKAIRKGSLYALKNPKDSLCMEFTDLFVAIARAAGIPTRELEGYAYTDNERLKDISLTNDILHSWPEYYDSEKQEWIMVDPTWEKTSGGVDYFNHLDMTHIVFAVHGLDSVFPVPAGSYRDESFSGKQIFVNFGKFVDNVSNNNFQVENTKNIHAYPFFNNRINIELKNISGKALYNQKIKETIISSIPPFGRIEYLTSIKPRETLKDYNYYLNLDINSNEYKIIISVKSLVLRIIISIFVFILISIIGIIFYRKKHPRHSERVERVEESLSTAAKKGIPPLLQ